MAATAYAALRSLLTTVAMEQTPSPLHPPFPFPSPLIDSLLETVRFMVDFLEQHYCTGGEHLMYRITDLAYAAEDAIELPILHLIRSSTAEELGPVPLGQDLERIIQDFDLVKADMLLLMKDTSIGLVRDFRSSGSSSSSSTAPTQMDKTQMVGFDEYKSTIIDQLTSYDLQPGRQIIPIVGMGGIGKTTLTRNVYDNVSITRHFDVRAWVTVSQQYNVDDILKGLLSSLQNEGEISGEQLHKCLFNRRYLVVFDDMWSIDVWDEIRQYFPDSIDNKGSRIIVTTRLSNLATELISNGFRLGMQCLDEKDSWTLFREKVFPSKSCPLGLQDVGKKIVRNCRGLPLAIAVIGGLLAKSNQTPKYWEYVAKDFHSCLQSIDEVLFLSYSHLPIHLKPCLLYLGVFPEDYQIRVSQLTNLWIAEGFLKPIVGKTLDEIAEEYLKDLIERNLIMVSSYSKMGKIKKIIIHDLLRELCLREARKDMFYCVVKDESIEGPLSMAAYQRRIVIGNSLVNAALFSDGPDSLVSIRHVRALLHSRKYLEFPSHLSSLMPLRILFSPYRQMCEEIYGNFTANCVNMRYLHFAISLDSKNHMPYASIGLWRNFQILEDDSYIPVGEASEIDIWDLVHLVRVRSEFITDPEHSYGVEDQHSCIVLENLQSLGRLVNFRFSEEVMRRIPNVKKLKVFYYMDAWEGWSHYSAHNLERLEKLETFSCAFEGFTHFMKEVLQRVVFPPSLKKLYLEGCELKSEDVTRVFGSLPHLEVLTLHEIDFVGGVWNPVEGEFLCPCLKFLKMTLIYGLKKWNADCTHFPRLEILILEFCYKLEEIPLDFGKISTLRLIELQDCSLSAMKSAKNILEDQQSFGNEDLVVEVDDVLKHRSIHDVEIKNFVATSEYDSYDESDVEEERDENDDEETHENVQEMEPNVNPSEQMLVNCEQKQMSEGSVSSVNSVIGSLGRLAALDDSALVFNTGVVEGHQRSKSKQGRHLNKKKNLMSASQHAQLRQDSNETTSKVIRWDPLKVGKKNSCSSMEFNPGDSIFVFGQGTYTTNNGARNESTMNRERENVEEAQGCQQEVSDGCCGGDDGDGSEEYIDLCGCQWIITSYEILRCWLSKFFVGSPCTSA